MSDTGRGSDLSGTLQNERACRLPVERRAGEEPAPAVPDEFACCDAWREHGPLISGSMADPTPRCAYCGISRLPVNHDWPTEAEQDEYEIYLAVKSLRQLAPHLLTKEAEAI